MNGISLSLALSPILPFKVKQTNHSRNYIVIRNKEKEEHLLSTDSLPKCPQQLWLGHAVSWSQVLSQGLPCGGQRSKDLPHHLLCPEGVMSRKVELGAAPCALTFQHELWVMQAVCSARKAVKGDGHRDKCPTPWPHCWQKRNYPLRVWLCGDCQSIDTCTRLLSHPSWHISAPPKPIAQPLFFVEITNWERKLVPCVWGICFSFSVELEATNNLQKLHMYFRAFQRKKCLLI